MEHHLTSVERQEKGNPTYEFYMMAATVMTAIKDHKITEVEDLEQIKNTCDVLSKITANKMEQIRLNETLMEK